MSGHGDETHTAYIRWTTHGVAHIRADDWGGLGFGQGWACARDHLPALADQIAKVRSERAAYHGAGPDGANVASDFGYRVLDLTGRSAALRDAQPAHLRQLISGYVAGANAQLGEALATESLPPWCADATASGHGLVMANPNFRPTLSPPSQHRRRSTPPASIRDVTTSIDRLCRQPRPRTSGHASSAKFVQTPGVT